MEENYDVKFIDKKDGSVVFNLGTNSSEESSHSITIMQLSYLKEGETFSIDDEEFMILEQLPEINATKVIRTKFLKKGKRFNLYSIDWKSSPIRDLLNNKYYKKIAGLIGEKNIIPMQRDLTSLDGIDYGTCEDKISLLSAKEYAQYHKIFGKHVFYSHIWWTITPWSSPGMFHDSYACCVIEQTGYFASEYVCCKAAVRPFLCLNSSMFITKQENY